ncbi:MAG: hypothetical protein H7177_13440 [Rhizobacter sp.]|nr:hypothetical protein [Bacteriovorax sp.]
MKFRIKHIQIYFMAALLLFTFSCSKQESPDIESSEVRTQSEVDRLEACSAVNFNKGVLLHLNMLLLFKCTQWDEQFPKMYQGIKRISSASWDHFMAPIDKEFVENLSRRDRVFKNIHDLDAKNGLDDLSRVLVALNETNFFDSVKAMFTCVDDPASELCKDRNAIPAKKSLKNIIKLIDTSPDSIDRASSFIKALNVAIGTNEEKLRTEVNKFLKDPVFIDFRLRLVDAVSKKVQTGLTKDDRVFMSQLLLTGSRSGNPWIYTWIHDVKMTRDKFRDLVEYPILANPAFVGEIKGLKQAYDDGFNCTIKNTMDPNELLNFDFKTHLYDYVTIIRNRDYKGYYDFTSAELVGLKMSTEVCRELVTNKYNTNFIKMLTNLSTFLGEKKFYDLIKFLATQTPASGDINKTFAENLYLFDLIASDIFNNANLLNEQIVKHTRDMYPTIFDVVQNLPPEAYTDLGAFLQETLKAENDEKFKGVADFWSFFNSKEKNFVFNFMDRHFEGDTNFVLLFDFYAKFLDDLRDTAPIFKDKWMGTDENEEMSYLSLQDFFNQLAGADTLLDFQKFFSRDQILKVLEVISNGSNINAKAKEELAYRRSDEYITRSKGDKYIFKVTYDPGTDAAYDSRPVIECLQKFSQIENGFYELVRKLPEACSKVTNENIAFRLFGWLNNIEDSFKEFKPGNVASDSILDKKGILSPYMLNTTLGTAKILDTLLGDVDSQLPTKNGISYFMNSARFHLNEQKAAALVDKNLSLLTKWFEVLPEQNTIHRNALLKTFTGKDNFARANDVSKNAAALSIQYSDWVKKGKLDIAQKRSLGAYDPAFDCDKVINKVITPNPCPSKEIVKKYTNSIIKFLGTVWEKDQGSPVGLLLKSVKPGEGIDVPLNGSKTKKYRLTIKETFKYMYDASDKSFPINNTKTYFQGPDGKNTNETLTTLERIEVVIRDVRFDNNYLGVAFLNGVTHAEDYNDEVAKRRGLLSKCIKIPVIRCLKPMSNDDLRQAQNALETFDSLLDINNGRGLEPRLSYGNFLRTFEQTLVASSAKNAQEVQLNPLKEEYLLQHNGHILGDMTMMTAWSNVARVIRDRVGRKREDFDKFINSSEFNRVDKALLYGFDLPQAGPSAERLLRKVLAVPAGEKQNISDNTIDWIASLNYDQTRLLEDTVSKILLMSSYLGTPQTVFGVNSNNNSFERYKDNNLLQVFLALEKVIDYWPTIRNYVPNDMNLVDALKPVNNALVFFTDALGSTNDPDKNIAYKTLNDIFVVAQTTLFDEMSDPKIGNAGGTKVKGIDLAVGFLQNPKLVNQAYTLARDDYRYLDLLHANQASFFKAFGINLGRVAANERIDLTPVRDYLNFTTKSKVCLNRDSECPANYHFDEPANLVKYLNKSEKFGSETNFMLATRKILVENFDQLNKMIDDLIPCLKIQQVKPPFKLN